MVQITVNFLFLTEKTRERENATFSEPQFITRADSAHDLGMMNIPISTCFYKGSNDFCSRPGTREWGQVFRMNYPKFVKLKVRLCKKMDDWQLWAKRGNLWQQRHIVDGEIARGRSVKGQSSQDISLCDLHSKVSMKSGQGAGSAISEWVIDFFACEDWSTVDISGGHWTYCFEHSEELFRVYLKFSRFLLKISEKQQGRVIEGVFIIVINYDFEIIFYYMDDLMRKYTSHFFLELISDLS